MPTNTGGLLRKSLDTPDEVRPFENDSGELQIVNVGGESIVGRAIFKPGWRWSKDVKPIAKTESCQGAHAGYVISGRMRVRMDDGTEDEFGPGDVMIAAPGHDAWVVGDEAMVVIDWQGFADYAKRT
ncbi:MAG TPA: cupin domain-containing protein [Candidatus Dormibacteraeota bacterium]|nr:cupin domain-containing protein [Candidatus Dormibacteraeota bacterium]